MRLRATESGKLFLDFIDLVLASNDLVCEVFDFVVSLFEVLFETCDVVISEFQLLLEVSDPVFAVLKSTSDVVGMLLLSTKLFLQLEVE